MQGSCTYPLLILGKRDLCLVTQEESWKAGHCD